MLTGIKLVQNTHCFDLTMLVQKQSGIQKKNKCEQKSNWYKIHTAPYIAGIEPVWYSVEKQMLTGMKLVQNTHCSLQCWYRTSLLFRRKTNANKNQTDTKYTLLLTILLQNQSGIQKKNKNANENQTGTKYTLLLTMLVQKQSGIQKKNKY